jgi:hypothetical protein
MLAGTTPGRSMLTPHRGAGVVPTSFTPVQDCSPDTVGNLFGGPASENHGPAGVSINALFGGGVRAQHCDPHGCSVTPSPCPPLLFLVRHPLSFVFATKSRC